MDPMRRGQLLRHYLLDVPIDRGGMGIVWRAKDTRSAETVVLKCLPSTGLTPEEAEHLRKRLRREARILLSLRHPSIVSEVEWFEETGEIYLVLEYLEGMTMGRWIKRMPPLGERLAVLRQVATAVAFAHSQGVIHRDLKPDNVIVGPDSSAKVLDFGLARALDSTLLTHTGMFLGTIRYMAPEQARGERVDELADVYSLGVMLAEILELTGPFRKSSTGALGELLTDRPVELDHWLPDDIRRSLQAMLAKDPQKRTQQASQVKEKIEILLAEGEALGARLEAAKASPAASILQPAMAYIPRTDVTQALDELVVKARASREGACLAVMATPGMGCSTELQAVAYRLRAGGFSVQEGGFLEYALPRFIPWKILEQRLAMEDDATIEMPAGDAWEQVVPAFVAHLRRESRAGGVALVLDNVSLATPEDLAWIEELLGLTGEVPLLLVLGCDPAPEGAGPSGIEAYGRFLRRLAERHAHVRVHLKRIPEPALKDAIVRGGASPDAVGAIAGPSGGVPALVNVLLERWHVGEDVGPVLADGPSVELQRLARRVERLDATLRSLLAALATSGGRCSVGRLAEILGESELTVRSKLHDLDAKHGFAVVRKDDAFLTQPFLGAVVATAP